MLRKTVQAKLKSIRARITRNPLTTTFFLVGLVHCIAQGAIQSFLFAVDSEYGTFLSSITTTAQVPLKNHTNLLGNSDRFQLEICNFIPHTVNCTTAFDSRDFTNDLNKIDSDPSHDTILRGEIIMQHLAHGFNDSTLDASDPSQLLKLTSSEGDVFLSLQCIQTLLYPEQHLQNSRRESIALLAFQLWLFGLSIIAMCYDSVPHVLTGLGARTLLTAWSIYTLWRTSYQENIFHKMIEESGTPCSFTVFPMYFQIRIRYGIPDLVLNCTALGFAAYLSWALMRVFNSESVQRVGAPKQITRIYKYFLAVQVCLQLEAFTLMAWMGLWLDQLRNSYIREITNHLAIYTAVFIWYAVLLGPWMLVGWFGIKYEKRIVTGIFILMAFVFTTFACIMFYSQVYRWTFYVWPFLGCFTVGALVLLVATLPLSIICWKNFNKGLAQYLYAESALASSNFTAEVFEHDVEKAKAAASVDGHKKLKKVSDEGPLPTYYLSELSPTSTMISYDSHLDHGAVAHNHGYF